MKIYIVQVKTLKGIVNLEFRCARQAREYAKQCADAGQNARIVTKTK